MDGEAAPTIRLDMRMVITSSKEGIIKIMAATTNIQEPGGNITKNIDTVTFTSTRAGAIRVGIFTGIIITDTLNGFRIAVQHLNSQSGMRIGRLR
jgi:hypothetical protein